jgi:AcrR family transcriptional regulator
VHAEPVTARDSSVAPTPALRADARRNRERIVEAARVVFAEQGLGASMNEVARRAGVGLATLLRRFPSRDLLVAAALGDRMGEFAALVERALDDPDPWNGFCWLVHRICAMQAGDRGFTEVLTQAFPGAGEFEELRELSYRRTVELFDRAKDAGVLRLDFSPHDFPMLLMANAGVVTATAGLAPTTSPRLIAYLLQAFSTASAPLPEPPTFEEMTEVLNRYEPPRP